MTSPLNKTALNLFAPIAHDYGVWSRVLSFGQDPRWRNAMVRQLALPTDARILDVAAGTGEVTRLLQQRGYKVISLDQSPEMLAQAVREGAVATIARAETLPFPSDCFDGLTFTYLLRYVDDPLSCMVELARVVRSNGRVGMVEFGRPRGIWGSLWVFYTRLCLPLAGKCVGRGWHRVGSFLGQNIDDFWQRFPDNTLAQIWESAGFSEVTMDRKSLGGGVIMTGRKI
jgi:demethylmenaquinone methyltransferase/2-methoxy-6-polyprenyl-1,4-benzoquinol methylase